MNGYTMAYDIAGDGVPLVFIHQVATDADFGIISGAYFIGGIA